MIKLIANYSKRLGLPGYSSHQFSVSVEAELSNINDVAEESSRLYQLLQHSVDEEIQNTGYVPTSGYGANGISNGSGHSNGNGQNGTNGNGYPPNGNGSNGHSNGSNGNGHNGDAWNCSDKQRELITKLVEEHNLDRMAVDETANQMFGVGVKELNKLQASGLIEQLIEENGGSRRNRSRPRSNGAPRRTYAGGSR